MYPPAYTNGPSLRQAEDAVRVLLAWVGDNPDRDGLKKTPSRVVRALADMTEGSVESPANILTASFDEHFDQMIVLRDIEFTSLCEHHMLPFYGSATVGYIPSDGYVVGVSKLARLVECYARRLQVQERITLQVADALQEHIAPLGVGVILKAKHMCMVCRGVRKDNSEMVTSCLYGCFRDDAATRSEFMQLAL